MKVISYIKNANPKQFIKVSNTVAANDTYERRTAKGSRLINILL